MYKLDFWGFMIYSKFFGNIFRGNILSVREINRDWF